MGAQVERGISQQTNIRYECPHCGSHVFTLLVPANGGRSDTQESWWTAVCTDPHCRLPCIVQVLHASRTNFYSHTPDDVAELAVSLLPAPTPVYAEPSVPKPVAADLTEALGCEAAGFHVAAAVVGRRALQAAVRERLTALGIAAPSDKLFAEIDALPDEELPERWKKAAHEVRHLGNDGAHAEPVSPAEAAAVLRFTKGVLEQLYVLPAELDASKSGRQVKKATTP